MIEAAATSTLSGINVVAETALLMAEAATATATVATPINTAPLTTLTRTPTAQDVTTSARTDGTQQLVYKGRPVYDYAGDSKAGDKKGDGIGGIWHVVPEAASFSATCKPFSMRHPGTAAYKFVFEGNVLKVFEDGIFSRSINVSQINDNPISATLLGFYHTVVEVPDSEFYSFTISIERNNDHSNTLVNMEAGRVFRATYTAVSVSGFPSAHLQQIFSHATLDCKVQ